MKNSKIFSQAGRRRLIEMSVKFGRDIRGYTRHTKMEGMRDTRNVLSLT